MRKPFNQTTLVNKLDTPAALAWVEQRLLLCRLSVTYPAGIHILGSPLSLIKSWVIHQIGE